MSNSKQSNEQYNKQYNKLKEYYEKNKDNIIATFSCPITTFVSDEPVVADDGNIYDYDTIKDWYNNGKHKSPLTKQRITDDFKPIQLWKEIFNVFVEIDPELKDYIMEKDNSFETNKFIIAELLENSSEDHHLLKKYKNYKLFDNDHDTYSPHYIFLELLLENCNNLNIIKYVFSNCDDLLNKYNGKHVLYFAYQHASSEVINYIENLQFTKDSQSIKDILLSKKIKSINSNGEIDYDNHDNNNDNESSDNNNDNDNDNESSDKSNNEKTEYSSIYRYGLINKKINDNYDIMKKIFDNIEMNELTIGNKDIVSYAIENYTMEIIRLLLDNYCDEIEIDYMSLIKSIFNNDNIDFEAKKYLIELCMKKDVTVKDKSLDEEENTLAHFISWKCAKDIEMIKYMSSIDLNLELENKNRWRPIHFICRYGNRETIEYIMGIGICLTALCNFDGQEVVCYNLVDVNDSLDNTSRNDIIRQFIEFIEIIAITNELNN